MESESNSNVAFKPPPLNSDQLNYLIWRYLQEAGYGDAAVKLQRDWKVEQPETLPFAKHIKGQALVSLVQKGLRYHHLSLTIDENGRPLKQINPSTFFFGAESARPATSDSAKEPLYRTTEPQRSASPVNSTNLVIPKKREADPNLPLDSIPGPAKRGRKPAQASGADRNGNGVRKTSASTSDAPMGMDIDQTNGNMRSPSLGEKIHDDNMMNGIGIDARTEMDIDVATPGIGGMEPLLNDRQESLPPIIPTLTNGESVGIQVAPAKVANLGPSTTVVSMPETSHVSKSVWRPLDASLLTVSGDHFCGAWKHQNSDPENGGPRMTYQDLIEPDSTTSITAVAWEPNGGLLAIAAYSDLGGQLHLFDGRELTLSENLPASQRPIISLKWLSSGLQLVGITPGEDQTVGQTPSSTILLWDFSDMQFSQSPLQLAVPELLTDVDSATYAGQGIICTAGGNAVYCCRATNELLVEEKWSSSSTDGINWFLVKCTRWTENELAVVVASADTPRIWLPTKDIGVNDAHNAPITGLELRPRIFQPSDSAAHFDFATSSEDATIKVWRYSSLTNSVEMLQRLSIDVGAPVMSLAFSLDGFCLAGASYSSVRIWNAEHGYNLMASWNGHDDEWRGSALKEEDAVSAAGMSSVNGDGAISSIDHSLAWDSDSKKLAFCLGSQVAIINFQR